ncbi:MAG: hypothetical protein L6R35_003971 [Caloplaca aegaea]|nr:MAG: hypothetical protein L6R35_003971 [Caloplaca aegaea]
MTVTQQHIKHAKRRPYRSASEPTKSADAAPARNQSAAQTRTQTGKKSFLILGTESGSGRDETLSS